MNDVHVLVWCILFHSFLFFSICHVQSFYDCSYWIVFFDTNFDCCFLSIHYADMLRKKLHWLMQKEKKRIRKKRKTRDVTRSILHYWFNSSKYFVITLRARIERFASLDVQWPGSFLYCTAKCMTVCVCVCELYECMCVTSQFNDAVFDSKLQLTAIFGHTSIHPSIHPSIRVTSRLQMIFMQFLFFTFLEFLDLSN